MSQKADERGQVIGFLPAKLARLDQRLDRSLATLRTQRADLAQAISRLTFGFANLSEDPLLQSSREALEKLAQELAASKAELDSLIDALEQTRRDPNG